MGRLQAGYVLDEHAKDDANRAGQNYWWVYIAEVLDRLGLTATAVPPAEIARRLRDLSLLFVHGRDGSLRDADLDAWVRSGGTLIGCHCEGLDDLCGNELLSRAQQPGDDFSVTAELRLTDTPFTAWLVPPSDLHKPLLIASPLRAVRAKASQPLGETDIGAVITARQYDAGWAFYFGFDLAQTFWTIQQGRPVNADHDGDGYWRTADAIVIGDHDPEVPYTDILLFLVQNMTAMRPHPMVHQLPPLNGSVPDMVLYYGGDDEGEEGVHSPAAEFMHSRGLPYHINCMLRDGKFAVGPHEAKALAARRTEVSLHYNFMDGFVHPTGFAQADVRSQTEQFVSHFGKRPVCTVTHWCRWTGSAEPALWMSEQGVRADNSYLHCRSVMLNPINLIGFSFGTCYPFFFWTDHALGNSRVEFVELPITAYELGYEGERSDFERIERALDLASHYQATMNFFYHPVYIAKYPACRKAIDRLLSLIQERGLKVLHSTPDAVAQWWLDRSRTRIEEATFQQGTLRFRVCTPSPLGCIVKVPVGSFQTASTRLPHEVSRKFGQKWLMLVLGKGETDVKVELH